VGRTCVVGGLFGANANLVSDGGQRTRRKNAEQVIITKTTSQSFFIIADENPKQKQRKRLFRWCVHKGIGGTRLRIVAQAGAFRSEPGFRRKEKNRTKTGPFFAIVVVRVDRFVVLSSNRDSCLPGTNSTRKLGRLAQERTTKSTQRFSSLLRLSSPILELPSSVLRSSDSL